MDQKIHFIAALFLDSSGKKRKKFYYGELGFRIHCPYTAIPMSIHFTMNYIYEDSSARNSISCSRKLQWRSPLILTKNY